MPSECLQSAFRVPSECLQSAFRVPSEYVQSIFRVCLEYVQGMFRVCSEYIQSRFRVCSEYVQGMFRVCSEYVQGMYRVWSEYVQSISLLFSSSLFGGQQRPLMHCALRAQSFLQLFNTFSLFFISREKISLLHGFPTRQCRFYSSNVNETLHKLSVPKRTLY